METERNLIQEIFAEKAKDDSNSRDLARMLDTLSTTVFGEINRFVFELLQNADDAATDDGRLIDVQFRLLDNYIVFSHDGEHFSANDVRGISGVATGDGQKDKAEEKTGYKGIGFKSVFGSSTYVHIISGRYSFRYDKDHEHWNGQPRNFPWQVVPIWTDNPVDEVSGVLDKKRVTTVIKVSNRTTIRREILKVFEDSQIMLFLRRVKRISFYDNDEKIFELEKHVAAGGTHELYKNKVLQSSWKVQTYEIAIPKHVNHALQLLGPQQCPEKLKTSTKTKLTFAASIKDGKIDPLKEAVIYSYLPTNACYDFPFLVNGDFLMDAARTGLMTGEWNDFLFRCIADMQLKWIVLLQLEDYCFDVPKLIKTKFKGYSLKSFQTEYNEQLLISLNEVPFLLDKKEDRYHLISKCIIDHTMFSEFFPEQIIREFLGTVDDSVVVNFQYQDKAKLVELGAKSLGVDDVFMMIEKRLFSGWKQSHTLACFLHFGSQQAFTSGWNKNCSIADFLADENEFFRSPNDIFFPFRNGEELPDIDHSDLHFVNSDILGIYDPLGTSEFMEWLNTIGVKEPSETEIAKKAVIPMVKKDKITASNTISLTRLLVRVHARNDLSEADYETLQQLKLLTSQGISAANKCYLLPLYGGEQDLDKILRNEHFVSTDYTDDIEEEQVPHYKIFFKKIGCSRSLTISIIDETVSIRDLEKRYPESEAFFDWLEQIDLIPSMYRHWRSTQHSYSGFTKVDFLQQLHQQLFAKHFWTLALNNWDSFVQDLNGGKYYVRGASFSTISFIQYYSIQKPVVPCTDGQCRSGKDVFTPVLKNIVGDYLPVADFPMTITAAQRDFFSLKKVISVAECLTLLTKISDQNAPAETIKQTHAIYGHLVGMGIHNDPLEIKRISKWMASGLMLASDNTFQPARNLWLFNVPGLDTNAASSHFLKLPTNMEAYEKIAFCDLFGIHVITVDKLEFLPENPLENVDLPKKLFTRMHHFALLKSAIDVQDFNSVLQKMSNILQGTVFYQADRLSFVFKDDQDNVLYENTSGCSSVKGQGFFFVGEWWKPKTLFEVIDPLCDLLSLSEHALGVTHLMLLDDEDAKEWLVERGYDIGQLDIELQGDLFEQEVDEVPDLGSSGLNYEISFVSESFDPQVQPDEVDLDNISVITKDYSHTSITPSKSYIRPTNQEFTKKTGDWAEDLVDKYLRKHSDVFSEVVWINQDGEKFLPYDFTCKKDGELLYIDAKGTPSSDKAEVYLSDKEWQFIFEKGKNYSLFRIYRVGYPDARVEAIYNVAEKIARAEILPNPIAIII